MTSARFEVAIDQHAAIAFATLSDDWNPLHTDAGHAAGTPYRRPVLHGAFSAGLVSRMAGMFLPGTDCLFHAMQLRFLAPIVPPARLGVSGHIAAESGTSGRVDVVIDDLETGVRYVEASYEFGRHELGGVHRNSEDARPPTPRHVRNESVVLVTGASGGLGRAVCTALGDSAIGLSRVASGVLVAVPDLERLPEELERILEGRRVSGVVHCALPAPDNVPLTQLNEITPAIEHFISAPLPNRWWGWPRP
jgi:acyl dehydratase